MSYLGTVALVIDALCEQGAPPVIADPELDFVAECYAKGERDPDIVAARIIAGRTGERQLHSRAGLGLIDPQGPQTVTAIRRIVREARLIDRLVEALTQLRDEIEAGAVSGPTLNRANRVLTEARREAA